MQPDALPSVQAKQEASQLPHVASSSTNLVAGQAVTHAPSSKKRVPSAGQLTHAVDCAPLHSAHDAWHASHTASPSARVVANVWLVQLDTHMEPCRKGAAPAAHERHSSAAGPVQRPHDSWHALHTPDAFSHLPTGVQSARHELGGSTYG